MSWEDALVPERAIEGVVLGDHEGGKAQEASRLNGTGFTAASKYVMQNATGHLVEREIRWRGRVDRIVFAGPGDSVHVGIHRDLKAPGIAPGLAAVVPAIA